MIPHSDKSSVSKKPLNKTPPKREPQIDELSRRKLLYKKKMIKKQRIKRAFFKFLVFFVLYVLILGIYVFSSYISYVTVGSEPSAAYTYRLSDENGKTTELSRIYENGAHYVCIDFLADLEKITIAGDLSVRSIVLKDSGEWADFYTNSNKACINGTFVTSSSVFLIRDYKLFVPVSFLEDYTYGLSFDYGDGVCNISRLDTVSFRVKPADTLVPLPLPD